ncbi:FGGY family carbohydrate kinase [Cryobacterium tagatosivorans]|uniref:Xylulose kinase n=1 Tax=Cryobacterium tagatosivorans TaxID=1259199 RepID=A0A4R8UD54_9MICO|nr:FGGY family carbohydrate kinase [Cryobacterium tagatosivorans]TFB47296.1 xylulose kinase [Cryobacterium tagatosivorans]
MPLVAGVDSSTQSCKIVIRDAATGAFVRSGRAPHPAGSEVDPAAWWDALLVAIADAGGLADVAAISVAAQQHGMVALDDAGRVIRPALLWNDTRSAPAAAALVAEVGAGEYARRAGSVPVASFTVTKLRWLRDAEPANAARVAAVALPHDWLTWRLRGFGPAGESPLGPVFTELTTDRSDASGTGYWSPRTGEYDLDLFERALGHSATLPRVLGPADSPGATAVFPVRFPFPASPFDGDSGVSYANTGGIAAAGTKSPSNSMGQAGQDTQNARDTPDTRDTQVRPPAPARRGAVPAGIVLGPGAGDNAGAALGLGAGAGDVVVSIGTSGTVFAVTDVPAADASGTVAGFADASGLFLPLVATLNAARVLDSIAGLLGVDHTELGRLALHAEPGAGGLVLQPWFEGERTPNLPDATASVFGMTIASTTRPNLARAAFEGLLCGLAGGLDAVRGQGVRVARILLIGGAAQNPALQAIAAQVFDCPIVVPEPGEYVADGAAAQAAWALTGQRPAWRPALAAQPAADFRPVIRAQYAERA